MAVDESYNISNITTFRNAKLFVSEKITSEEMCKDMVLATIDLTEFFYMSYCKEEEENKTLSFILPLIRLLLFVDSNGSSTLYNETAENYPQLPCKTGIPVLYNKNSFRIDEYEAFYLEHMRPDAYKMISACIIHLSLAYVSFGRDNHKVSDIQLASWYCTLVPIYNKYFESENDKE